ncbi:MAG: 3-hydroxybutyryl-CoA dehydrogenase [Planctomycetaceae bacterium]|nr:3-hydroxybutyryl-CoA dehydrogenase [Planctomycetaceae bacterium]
MDANRIERALVIGAGTMGHGIAHVLAMCGIEARLADVSQGAVDAGLAKVRANLQKGVERGKLTQEQRDGTLARLSGWTDNAAAAMGVQVVIEAVPEKLALKRQILGDLGGKLGPDVLLATNTSSLSIADIAEAVPHPERVTGMHFFNPVHLMKLVEVVRAPKSSDGAVALSVALAVRLGKEPITVRDTPGFASSRLGIAIGMEAIRMVEEEVASPEDIDKAMTLGYGFPMGPLRLTDLVGLDVRLSIAEYLASTLGPRFEPPKLLRDMVTQGHLGQKNGRGFYHWDT